LLRRATIPPFVVRAAPGKGRVLDVCLPPGRSAIIATSSAAYHALKARWGVVPKTNAFDLYAGSREPEAGSGLFENRMLVSATSRSATCGPPSCSHARRTPSW